LEAVATCSDKVFNKVEEEAVKLDPNVKIRAEIASAVSTLSDEQKTAIRSQCVKFRDQFVVALKEKNTFAVVDNLNTFVLCASDITCPDLRPTVDHCVDTAQPDQLLKCLRRIPGFSDCEKSFRDV